MQAACKVRSYSNNRRSILSFHAWEIFQSNFPWERTYEHAISVVSLRQCCRTRSLVEKQAPNLHRMGLRKPNISVRADDNLVRRAIGAGRNCDLINMSGLRSNSHDLPDRVNAGRFRGIEETICGTYDITRTTRL